MGWVYARLDLLALVFVRRRLGLRHELRHELRVLRRQVDALPLIAMQVKQAGLFWAADPIWAYGR